jgi:hypothetical protein
MEAKFKVGDKVMTFDGEDTIIEIVPFYRVAQNGKVYCVENLHEIEDKWEPKSVMDLKVDDVIMTNDKIARISGDKRIQGRRVNYGVGINGEYHFNQSEYVAVKVQ